MNKTVSRYNFLFIIIACIIHAGCKVPVATQVPVLKPVPGSFTNRNDTVSSADLNWRDFFTDKNLVALIDTAINNNPDVLIAWQDIEIARNNVRAKAAALYPQVEAGGAVSIDRVGRYTSQGAGDASTEITPGKIVPENLTNIDLSLRTSWEVDIWGKLRSAKKAAFAKYLGSIEGKNFVLTNLIAEVANTYYELVALDNQLEIVRQSIQLQKNQLEIVKVQKEAAAATELAVTQFEAQVYNSQGMENEILQKITENENKLNFLLGRYPQSFNRDTTALMGQVPSRIKEGVPSQLLKNRPDIKQAEMELLAAKWDVKVAQKEFYPSLSISGVLGLEAFKPNYLYKMPESVAYSLIGELAGPVINRKAIIAEFKTASAYQVEAMYDYQKAILSGYLEVSNELSNINNLGNVYGFKSKEVETLARSVDISNDLFKAARANYLEVLTAQRDALASKLELIDIKKQQFNSVTSVYKALGGGWR
jgi:NodT family efflux transporter outer membrane factor (OMF) lipoprotein